MDQKDTIPVVPLIDETTAGEPKQRIEVSVPPPIGSIVTTPPVVVEKPAAVIATPPPDAKKTVVRRPGRPPKKKKPEAIISTHGIVDEPSDSDNVVELVYSKPEMFKKLFALFKKYEIREIVWKFLKDRVEINLLDHKKKTPIFVTIHGRLMHKYYCEEPISCCINRINVDNLFKSINKDSSMISIILQKDTSRSKMHVVIRNNEASSDKTYSIDLITPENPPPMRTYNDAEYPIKFNISGKNFKEFIGGAATCSDSASFERVVDEHDNALISKINATYVSNKKMVMTENHHDPNKLQIVDKLQPDDIFVVGFYVSYIKQFASANMGSVITVAADKTEPISFTTHMNEVEYTRPDYSIVQGYACTIKVYSDVKK